MAEFTIDPEFRDLLPALSDDEFARLRDDINKNGCRDKLVIWREWKILIDGHNRHDICTTLDLPFETTEMSFTCRDDVKLWMIRNQLARRNITDAKRVVLNLMLKPVLAAKAIENKSKAGGDKRSESSGSLRENSTEAIPPLNTREEIAKASGVSTNTVSRVETVMAEAEEPVKEQMLSGEISINKAYETVRPHVANNSGNNEWYTPPAFVESARAVMGSIDLDPASCEIANKTVGAATYYTAEIDGLAQQWSGRVWLNPPYSSSLIGKFSDAVVARFNSGEITEACVLVNNATETEWCQRMLRIAAVVCFPSSRIKFLDPTGKPNGAPLQGQVILYFGASVAEFVAEFSKHGMCYRRCI